MHDGCQRLSTAGIACFLGIEPFKKGKVFHCGVIAAPRVDQSIDDKTICVTFGETEKRKGKYFFPYNHLTIPSSTTQFSFLLQSHVKLSHFDILSSLRRVSMLAGPSIPPAALRPTSSADIELSRIHSENHGGIEEQRLTEAITYPSLSRWKTFTIISTVTGITVLNSMQNGIVTVGLPTIGRDLDIPQSLILWSPLSSDMTDNRPSSVYSLACGCFLLFTGQLADVVGSRKVFLSGCLFYATFTLASGLSQTPLQLILFRALQGISIAACLPSAVSILSLSFPTGSTRNLAFAILGAGQPVGFASGMVLSGVFISKLSWRWAFYCSAIVNLGVVVGAWWGLPSQKVFELVSLRTFWRKVDWIGATLVSTSLGMIFYVLAYDPPSSPH